MDFSSLVLMERDKDGKFIREMDSYSVTDGAIYITKLYYDGEIVHLVFDTNKDVEEWEYSAIFDLFDVEKFQGQGFELQEIDDEYNPTWEVRFPYNDEYAIMEKTINNLCNLIDEALDKVFQDIKGKEEEYK